MRRNVYVSVNSDRTLDERRRRIKAAVLDHLEESGFSPQLFFERGLPTTMPWSFSNVREVMRRCVGALVLGFPRWQATPAGAEPVRLIGEYSHVEGGMALALGIPCMIMAEEGIADRGIVYQGAGKLITRMPLTATAESVLSGPVGHALAEWEKDLTEIKDIFFGYCSKSRGIASEIQLHLLNSGAKVHNWAMDFMAGGSILGEIERSSRICSRGVFLFSEDDPLEGVDGSAAPRDNVIFETGYFMSLKGAKNCLIIRIGKAKVPADLGGTIYLSLSAGGEVESIAGKIRSFVETGVV